MNYIDFEKIVNNIENNLVHEVNLSDLNTSQAEIVAEAISNNHSISIINLNIIEHKPLNIVIISLLNNHNIIHAGGFTSFNKYEDDLDNHLVKNIKRLKKIKEILEEDYNIENIGKLKKLIEFTNLSDQTICNSYSSSNSNSVGSQESNSTISYENEVNIPGSSEKAVSNLYKYKEEISKKTNVLTTNLYEVINEKNNAKNNDTHKKENKISSKRFYPFGAALKAKNIELMEQLLKDNPGCINDQEIVYFHKNKKITFLEPLEYASECLGKEYVDFLIDNGAKANFLVKKIFEKRVSVINPKDIDKLEAKKEDIKKLNNYFEIEVTQEMANNLLYATYKLSIKENQQEQESGFLRPAKKARCL